MKKLNYGVIGCGVFGEYQIMGVINLDNANLVAICDKDQNRMMEMAQKYNISPEAVKVFMGYISFASDGLVIQKAIQKEQERYAKEK